MVIHYNERADAFPVMKDGLNIHFKGTLLIKGIMMPQWMSSHSLVTLLNIKELNNEFLEV